MFRLCDFWAYVMLKHKVTCVSLFNYVIIIVDCSEVDVLSKHVVFVNYDHRENNPWAVNLGVFKEIESGGLLIKTVVII